MCQYCIGLKSSVQLIYYSSVSSNCVYITFKMAFLSVNVHVMINLRLNAFRFCSLKD